MNIWYEDGYCDAETYREPLSPDPIVLENGLTDYSRQMAYEDGYADGLRRRRERRGEK